MHIHYGPLFSARDEPSPVRHKRARGGGRGEGEGVVDIKGQGVKDRGGFQR